MATPKKKWLTEKWPHIKMNIQNGSKRMDGVWASIIFCHLIVYLFCFIFLSLLLSVLCPTCVRPGTCFLFIELVLNIGHCCFVCGCVCVDLYCTVTCWFWLMVAQFNFPAEAHVTTGNDKRATIAIHRINIWPWVTRHRHLTSWLMLLNFSSFFAATVVYVTVFRGPRF